MRHFIKILLSVTFIISLNNDSDAIENQFLFSPNGSEFSVIFPQKPETGMYYSYEGNECKTEYAILLIDKNSGLRAESTICKIHTNNNVNKDSMLEILKEHAEVSGVTGTTFQYSEEGILKIGRYHGVIESIGNTFESTWIIGNKSTITLNGSAPHLLYPAIQYDEFVSSLRISNKQ